MKSDGHDDWKRALHRGVVATRTEIEDIEQWVQNDPANLVARVTLLAASRGEARNVARLWLIQNAPWLPLGDFWAVPREDPSYDLGKRLWLSILVDRGSDPNVAASAAWYFVLSEPDLAEALLKRGLDSSFRDFAMMRALDDFYDTWLMRLQAEGRDGQVPAVAARARANMDAMFDAAPTARERSTLLWPLKQYAAMAGDSNASSLYMAASRAATGNEVPEHRLRTVVGLVALARGDVSGAERSLLESAESVQAGTVPSVTLAHALLERGHLGVVARYVEVCEQIVGTACAPIVVLRRKM